MRVTLLLALLFVARAVPVVSLYRAYLVSRSDGAVLFSIVQAVGMRATSYAAPLHDQGQASCRPGAGR